VLASVDRSEAVPAVASLPRDDESDPIVRTRLLLERITAALGVSCSVEVRETGDAIVAVCTGSDLGLLIGRHGQTIDSIQYLANAIVNRGAHDGRKRIEVDAAGYRARREEALHREALRAAEQAIEGGREVVLEPMSAIERRVVHERLKDHPGVATSSEGAEPHRYVVVAPA
jgi:spoIIIJ-associated protein